MSNHCRHCDRCRDIWLGAHTNAKGATWPDRCCPACAEAERLAAEYEHRAQMKRTSAEAWGLVTAARIARGEA